MNKQKGFTLIELLVVISIIGLLSTLAVVSLSSARGKSRDAKRLADIKQIQTALELYFNQNNNYPTVASDQTLGSGSYGFLTGNGFASAANSTSTYLNVPADPTNVSPLYYRYKVASSTTYSITFQLENATNGLAAGTNHTVTPSGIQ